MNIGESVQILRWVDANGEVTVGSDTNLGVSASGGSRFTMADNVEFERVWGSPVTTRTAAAKPFTFAERESTKRQHSVHIGQKQVDGGNPLILYGAVRIERDTQIASHVKVHGSLDIEPGVRIGGNVIVRGNVTLAADVSVSGHVFAEGEVRLGPRSRVGRRGGVKTVYAGGHMLIANDVEVEGWIVADAGGHTL
jgi:acyl-[acyl carrier protein]--UDP-N-acetylglucosamine O-acyltransferase